MKKAMCQFCHEMFDTKVLQTLDHGPACFDCLMTRDLTSEWIKNVIGEGTPVFAGRVLPAFPAE